MLTKKRVEVFDLTGYPGGEHFHHGGLDLLPPLDPSDQEEPLHTPRLLALYRDRPIFVLRGRHTE